MPLFPILLVAALMAVDGGLHPLGEDWRLTHVQIMWFTLAPMAAILILAWIGTWWCGRQIRRGHVRAFRTVDRIGRAARLLLVVSHLFAVLALGWLGTVRSLVGDLILVDEFIALLPALLSLTAIWWIHYPIERRSHQATLIRQLDEGTPLYPTLSPIRYVLLHVRMQLLLTLVPVLLIAAISETITETAQAWKVSPSSPWLLMGKIATAASVFVFAPMLARFTLDVTPLPDGPLRQSLLDVCHRHRVKIRQLLVWNTNGSVFNAAVMGVTGRLRYVLMTDALLETMDENQVQAVMAHEIGHVRRHHMPWMAACLFACILLIGNILEYGLYAIGGRDWLNEASDAVAMSMGVATMVVGLILFGWVCRRFERQADTFAVQHLSQNGAKGDEPTFHDPSINRITPDAVHVMCAALNSIARLNAIEISRPSWRHGSIGWRMEYLLSIIGLPASELPIDRKVKWLKTAAAMVLLLSCVQALVEYLHWSNLIT